MSWLLAIIALKILPLATVLPEGLLLSKEINESGKNISELS
jgi:hypothetical protein